MKPNLEVVRTDLEGRLRELRRTSLKWDDLEIETHPDEIDQVVASTGRELAVQRLEGNTRLLHEVEGALTRLQLGEYGVCAGCEEPIAPKRLAAVPWARLCVHCQEREEASAAEQEGSLLEAA